MTANPRSCGACGTSEHALIELRMVCQDAFACHARERQHNTPSGYRSGAAPTPSCDSCDDPDPVGPRSAGEMKHCRGCYAVLRNEADAHHEQASYWRERAEKAEAEVLRFVASGVQVPEREEDMTRPEEETTEPDLGLVPRPGPCAHGIAGGSHCSMCAAAASRAMQRRIDLVDFVELYARSTKEKKQ